MPNLTFKPLPESDVQKVLDIEVASFPADEAASLESLTYRQKNASELFLGAYNNEKLVGYICSTLMDSEELTHESMSTHVPDGKYIAIHSVTVHLEHRKQGIAQQMLQQYLKQLSTSGYSGIRLIAHEELVPLYEKAGFTNLGPSPVSHGSRPWFGLSYDFAAVVPQVRSPGQSWDSFDGIQSLLTLENVNAGSLYCPRPECRCLLLRAKTAVYVQALSTDFDLPYPMTASAPSTKKNGYWSVASPMSFENIGFTKNFAPPSGSESQTAGTIKFLTCADCDHGPLGWHDTEGRDLGLEVELENEGSLGQVRKGREFLLAVDRVRYKMA